MNVKGFLDDTNDLAIQQIITLGVPGTHMPAWGDRLDGAEIQAIVGFLRAWEPEAPEVAEPARGGGGPWWQSQSQPGGSGAQGPAWGQNSELQASGGQLPSGGQGKGRGGSGGGGGGGGGGGRPDWAGQGQAQGGAVEGQAAPAQAASAQEHAPAGQQIDAAGAAPGTPGTPSPTPAQQAGIGSGQGAHTSAAGQSGAVDAAAQHSPGAPWAQVEAPSPWWQELDARVLAILGGLALLSGALVALGLLGVSRANALGR